MSDFHIDERIEENLLCNYYQRTDIIDENESNDYLNFVDLKIKETEEILNNLKFRKDIFIKENKLLNESFKKINEATDAEFDNLQAEYIGKRIKLRSIKSKILLFLQSIIFLNLEV